MFSGRSGAASKAIPIFFFRWEMEEKEEEEEKMKRIRRIEEEERGERMILQIEDESCHTMRISECAPTKN